MKKKSPIKVILIIVLVIILLVIAGVGAIFISLKTKLDKTVLQLDNISEILAEEPASFTERVSFVEDGHVTFRVDKNDIWWMITREFEVDPDAALRDVLAQKGFDYHGVGFYFDQNEAVVDLEAQWSFIRVPLRIYLELTGENGIIAVKPVEIQVAEMVFTVEELATKFGVDVSGLEVSYKPESSWISKIENIEIGENCIYVTGPLETDSVYKVVLSDERKAIMALTQSDYSVISSVLYDKDTDPAKCYQSINAQLHTDPSFYLEYLDQLYPFLTAEQIVKHVDMDKNHGFAQRWYWNSDPSKYDGMAAEIYDEYYVNYRFLHSIMDELDNAYKRKRIKIGNEFDAEKFYGDQYSFYNNAVPLEGAKLCRVEVDNAFGCGLLVTGKDGNPYLLFDTMNENTKTYNVRRLDEADAKLLQEAEESVWKEQ